MDWHGAIERQADALMRILLALAAMAGLLEASRFGLPPDTYRAVLRSLRAAEAVTLEGQVAGHDPMKTTRLRLRLLLLCRTIADLIRRLLVPASDPVRQVGRELDRLLTALHSLTRCAIDNPDTS